MQPGLEMDLNVCSLCPLSTVSVVTCVPLVQDMTDCPSSTRNRVGQTWLSASFDSVNSCRVNFSGCWPVPHSIIESLLQSYYPSIYILHFPLLV